MYLTAIKLKGPEASEKMAKIESMRKKNSLSYLSINKTMPEKKLPEKKLPEKKPQN